MVVAFADVLKILFLIYVQLSCLISLVKTRRTNYLFFFLPRKNSSSCANIIKYSTRLPCFPAEFHFIFLLPHSADYVNKMKKFCKTLLKSLKLEFPKIVWKQAPNKNATYLVPRQWHQKKCCLACFLQNMCIRRHRQLPYSQ